MSYQVDTPGETIGSNCFVDSYRGVIALITPKTESNLGRACSFNLGSTIEINIDEETSLYSATVKVPPIAVSYSVFNFILFYPDYTYKCVSLQCTNWFWIYMCIKVSIQVHSIGSQYR